MKRTVSTIVLVVASSILLVPNAIAGTNAPKFTLTNDISSDGNVYAYKNRTCGGGPIEIKPNKKRKEIGSWWAYVDSTYKVAKRGYFAEKKLLCYRTKGTTRVFVGLTPTSSP